MKILMVSFISSSNLGDQLIYNTIDNDFLQGHTVKKYDYNLVSEDELTVLPESKESSLLKQIYVNYFRKTSIVDKWRDSVNRKNALNNPNWDAFLADLEQSDLLILGGGNAIFDLTPHSSGYFMFDQIVQAARKKNVPSFAFSIGIGPFITKKQEEAAVQTLANTDYVTVRDQKSYSYLAHLDNAHLSIDPVFGLDKVEKITTDDKKTIGLSIIDLINNKQTTEENNQYISDIVALIERTTTHNIILYSSEPKDYQTVRAIYEKVSHLDSVSMEYIDTIDKLMNLYARLDLVIGARMHSLIVAVSQAIPIIGFSWQPKVHAMFDMIETSDSVFPIHAIQSHQSEILTLIETKLNDAEIAEQIEKTNQIVQEKLAINKQIIAEVALTKAEI